MEFRKSTIREYFETIVTVAIIALFATTFVVQAFKIPTGSMESNLLIGDHLLVNKFIYGQQSGFLSKILPYREPKRIGGKSKYSLGKMVRLASDAIFSFSLTPLYIGLSAGLLFFILACVQIVYVSSLWLTGQFDRIVPGWSSLMAIILIASGTIMILLGFIGVYVGYIFQEIKRRPVYLLKKSGKNEQ